MNGDLENQWKARLFRLVQCLNVILSLRRTSHGSTNFGKTMLLEHSSEMS